MFTPPENFDLVAIRHIEDEIMHICNTGRDHHTLLISSHPIWEWACQVLNKPLFELRQEIEAHETGEEFATKLLSEKDHLLKLPLVLLEHLNRKD